MRVFVSEREEREKEKERKEASQAFSLNAYILDSLQDFNMKG